MGVEVRDLIRKAQVCPANLLTDTDTCSRIPLLRMAFNCHRRSIRSPTQQEMHAILAAKTVI